MNNIVYPYIFTENYIEYKEFLLQEFKPEFIANLRGSKPIKLSKFLESDENYQEKIELWEEGEEEVLFDGWEGKDMNKWFKFSDKNNNVEIELFNSYYVINNKNNIIDKIFEFPYPENLNNFISDCWRTKTKLFWKEKVLLNEFSSYKIHLPEVNIIDYHTTILRKLNKDV